MPRQHAVWAASATALALALAPAARAADHTWSGAGSSVSPGWSSAGNWSAGGAPSPGETIGTLTFPALTCACGVSTNDVPGLTVGTLAIVDDFPLGQSYVINGDGITLAGGLSVSAGPSSRSIAAFPSIGLPITLSAPQTWTIAGGPHTASQPGLEGVGLGAPVTGPGAALTVHLSNTAALVLSGDNEVGPVSISGASTSGAPAALFGGVVSLTAATGAALNAGDGNPITVSDAGLAVDGGLGPVRLTAGLLVVRGLVSAPTVTLDNSSYLQFGVPGSGATAGRDYSQLRSTGPVALGGARLQLIAGNGAPRATCPAPALGTVYTLVSTTGRLTGHFAVSGGPSLVGSLVPDCPAARPPFAVRIDYHETGSPQTVTATVVPVPPDGVGPGVGGAVPVSGVVLLRRPGRRGFVRLRRGTAIPSGSELDTTHGRVRLFAATSTPGATEFAQLHGGRFRFRQRGVAAPVFRLSAPLTGCTGGRAAAAARHKPRRRRRYVWVTEQNGHFNTRGNLVSTSVQGTSWLTEDTCATSRVRVASGTVRVRDLVHRRTIRLHAGQSYTARRRASRATPHRRSSAATAHLYWANADGTIAEANLNGTQVKVIATGQGAPNGVAVSSRHLYWANVLGTIVEADLNGTRVKTIATGQSTPYGMAVSGSHLYWANTHGRRPGGSGAIVEAHLDGTGAKTIVKGQTPNGVAVSGSHLYWANDTTIVAASLDGTGAKPIADHQSATTGVAVNGTHLYWADYGRYGNTGKIVEANLDGTGAKVIATRQFGPDGVAVSRSHLYWANTTHGEIVEANLDGTGAKAIVKHQIPRGLAVGP